MFFRLLWWVIELPAKWEHAAAVHLRRGEMFGCGRLQMLDFGWYRLRWFGCHYDLSEKAVCE